MKKDYFIPKMFQKMLGPTVLAAFGYILSDTADALVVGQRMGEAGLAAISLCLPITMLINIITYGFSAGGAVKFSQLLGSNQEKEAVQCFNRIWKSALLVGLIFAALANILTPQILYVLGASAGDRELYSASEAYMRIISLGSPLMILNVVFFDFLRNDNNEVIAARGFTIGGITDFGLNFLFVLLFDLGTAGAASATITGSAVAICFYLPAIIGKKKHIIRVERTSLSLKEVFYCFRTGFATSVEYLFQLVFILMVNLTMIRLGGEQYVAIFDIVYNMSIILLHLCNGVSEAEQPLVSAFTGEKSEDDCRLVRRMSIRCALLISGVAAALLFIFARYIAILFGMPEESLPEAVYAIRVYCLGFAFLAINTVLIKYYQAREEGGNAFVGVLLERFLIAIPGMLLFAQFGTTFVWIAFPASEAISLLLYLLYFRITEKKRRRFEGERIYRVTITGVNTEITPLIDGCEAFCDKWGASETQRRCVMLIIEEIVASIIRNALPTIPDGKIRVTLIAEESGDFTLHVLDNAVEYNPFSPHTLEETTETELGIDEISLLLLNSNTRKYLHRQFNGFNSLAVCIYSKTHNQEAELLQ